MNSFSAPVITNKGSYMVSGFRNSPRLDCICHRLHTVLTDAYKETQRLVSELKKYEDAAAALCEYVKQATGIQEALPVSIKHGGNTRPWTSNFRLRTASMRAIQTVREAYREGTITSTDCC